MSKKSLLSLALFSVMGLTACGGDAEQAEVAEEPAQQQVEYLGEEQINPAVTEGAIMMDTSSAGTTLPQDTAAVPANTPQ